MCTEVFFGEYDDPIQTLGELRERFEVQEDDVGPWEWPEDQNDYCLCGVDVEAVLERAGVSWSRTVDGSFQVRE